MMNTNELGILFMSLLLALPFAGAFLVYTGKKAKDYVAIAFGTLEFATAMCAFFMLRGETVTVRFDEIVYLGLDFAFDGFRCLYTAVATFMWMISIMFSKEYMNGEHKVERFYFFTLLTLFATVGVLLSNSLYTTFIFFEVMSFTSYVWVAQEEEKPALRAADTYLAVAVIGGLVMLMGISMLYYMNGSVLFADLAGFIEKSDNKTAVYAAGFMCLFGFGAKAGMFPLHIWLPKAHPVAPSPASALLSGMLTKAGIYGILMLTSYVFFEDTLWGTTILYLGVITMFLGAFIALFSTNLKRTLACSSMSQIGFILIGIGCSGLIGHEANLAISGTIYHMLNHSLIKLVLFTISGIVLMNAHTLELSKIRGFGRKKPVMHFAFLLGALGIGGIPLFNGYISKTMLHESIVGYIHMGGGSVAKTIEWIFLASGGMTLAYMFKLYRTLFIMKPEDGEVKKEKYMTPFTGIILTVSAVILPCLGLFSSFVLENIIGPCMSFARLTPMHESINFFSLENLKGAGISVMFACIIYLVIVMPMKLKNVWPSWLDLENLIYRPLILHVLPFFGALFARIADGIVEGLVYIFRRYILNARKEKVTGHERGFLRIGAVFDRIQAFNNVFFRRKRPKHLEYKAWFAERAHDVTKFDIIVEHSISFSLMLFTIGLVITMIYILFV